jgi:hypothetical protein
MYAYRSESEVDIVQRNLFHNCQNKKLKDYFKFYDMYIPMA